MLRKGKLHKLCAYIANLISPYTTDGVTLTYLISSMPNHFKLKIIVPYRVNLKRDNFQVALK